MADGFKIDINDVLKKTLYNQKKVHDGCVRYAQTSGKMMVADAKQNAKWRDRTGLSRDTMDAGIVDKNNVIEINLRGHTPQFKYLEYAMEKKYAILNPTRDKFATEVIKGWAEVLKSL
ncbi:hypothetical protein [Clostridium luticellarii]|jgi:hypothetical protein|uniref:Phage protein, HK97 gp10 family n=1 Tax=Clostridium luticellarii TaxID=1691940 RepID=A0A2T0BLI9_9CLOT|nr:hypothetical protein [Clostridium luticellarii]PRR84745.1 hypothetical protein CLLU_22840 [Clostridium luticellarii]